MCLDFRTNNFEPNISMGLPNPYLIPEFDKPNAFYLSWNIMYGIFLQDKQFKS